MNKEVLHITTKISFVSLVLSVFLLNQNSFSMEEESVEYIKNTKRKNEQKINSSLQNSTVSFIQKDDFKIMIVPNLNLCQKVEAGQGNSEEVESSAKLFLVDESNNQFELDDVQFEILFELPTPGSVFSNSLTYITPSISIMEEDSAMNKSIKYFTNNALKTGTKEAIKILPGGKIASKIYTTYSKTEDDRQRGNGTIARTIGNGIKNVVSTFPYGEQIIEVAQTLKAPGTETLAESLTLCALPITNTKMEGSVDEIIGSLAKSAVISYVPYGMQITAITGMLGKSLFGTETLAGGLAKTALNGINWLGCYEENSSHQEQIQEKTEAMR